MRRSVDLSSLDFVSRFAAGIREALYYNDNHHVRHEVIDQHTKFQAHSNIFERAMEDRRTAAMVITRLSCEASKEQHGVAAALKSSRRTDDERTKHGASRWVFGMQQLMHTMKNGDVTISM